jgi:predicted nucleic acid-binding protein
MVADASPLIFLAKIGNLALITSVFPGKYCIPRSVRKEVLTASISPVETVSLESFLKSCQIVAVPKPQRFATALSHADNEVLTLALRRRASFLLTDDRLLRQMAVVEGIRPMGTLGILLRSMEQGQTTKRQTRNWVETLVQKHQFRISIEVYDAVLQRIENSPIGRSGGSRGC